MEMNIKNPRDSGSDTVVSEVRLVREAYTARFNYDLRRMVEDLKAKESEHPERCAKLRAASNCLRLGRGPGQ